MKPHFFTRHLSILILAFLIAGAFLTGCSAVKTLEGADRDAVLVYSEPYADNLFAGLNDNDYAVFSKDFDEKMKTGMNEDAFATFQTDVIGKIGKYVSREVSGVASQTGFVSVVYNAKFEQEESVTFRLVFNAAEPHLISGIWLDSPKLREK